MLEAWELTGESLVVTLKHLINRKDALLERLSLDNKQITVANIFLFCFYSSRFFAFTYIGLQNWNSGDGGSSVVAKVH